jgi:predicted molibdopterin-dependent oxidoreductase YjgC
MITLSVDGRSTSVAAGTSVAAAIAIAAARAAGPGVTRRSVGGQLRAPLCGMGVCQECRVTVNGRAHVLSCQTLCAPGMDVQTGGAP